MKEERGIPLFSISFQNGIIENLYTMEDYHARVSTCIKSCDWFIINDYLISEIEPHRFLFEKINGVWNFYIVTEEKNHGSSCIA